MNSIFRFRALFASAILIFIAIFGFGVGATATASESMITRIAETGIDPDKPNITEAAKAAAKRHYDNASVPKTLKRYQIYFQGINREWLIESHRIYLTIKVDQPGARDCETHAEQLEKSGRAAPFSLGIAMLQLHCAEQLNQSTKNFRNRVDANFSHLLADSRGVTSLNPIPVFSMREASAMAVLLGAQMVLNKPHNIVYADQLVALTLFKFPDAPEGEQYRAFYFDLLAEDFGAGLFRERFRSTQAKISILLSTLRGMDASYKINAEEISRRNEKNREQRYRKHYLKTPLIAMDLLLQCSVDKTLRCTSDDLAPLFVLAEQNNPIAQAALALERLQGVVDKADVDQGLTLLKLAQQKLGPATFSILNASLAPNAGLKLDELVLRSALAGHHVAQVALSVRFFTDKSAVLLSSRWQRESKDLKLIAQVSGMFLVALDPKSPTSACKSVENGLRIFGAICLLSHSQDPPYSESTVQLLEWEASNLVQPNRAYYAEKYANALYEQGRYQAALEQYLSNTIENQLPSARLSELAVKGYRSIWITSAELPDFLDDKNYVKLLQLQFAAGAKGKGSIPWLFQQCQTSATACHALAGNLEALGPEQRAVVLEKARLDDPKGKYSSIVRNWVFENLRFDGEAALVIDALAAFELLDNPAKDLSYRYAWQRCGNRNSAVYSPALALRLVPKLLEKSNAPWIQDVGAVCLAANNQFDAATFAANSILTLVSKNEPENYPQMTLQKARLVLYANKQSPRFDSNEVLTRTASETLVALAGSEQVQAPTLLVPLLEEYLQVERETRQASGKGLLVNRKLGGYESERDYGSDHVIFAPYFLIERRKAQLIVARQGRYCRSNTTLPAGQWRCENSEVSTFALPKALYKTNVIAGKRTTSRCGALDCVHIELLMADTATNLPADDSPGLQTYVAVNVEAKSRRVISASVIDPEGRWLYDYQYDQQIAVNQLPDLCEAVAPAEQAIPQLKKSTDAIVATGRRSQRRNSSAPVLVIKAEDLKGSTTIADVLDALARTDKKPAPAAKICRYKDGMAIGLDPP